MKTSWAELSPIKYKMYLSDTVTRPLPNGIVPCLLCGKPFMMPVFIGEPDQVCPECQAQYGDTAKVICKTCRVTICRVVSKQLDNGFYIRPHSILRSNACNVCKPGLSESTIVEIDEWERTMRPKKITIVRR